MKEKIGDLWENFLKPNNVIVVTTNNEADSRGNLIMGAGTAKQAKERFPHLPEWMSEYVDWDYHFVEFAGKGIACLQTKRCWRNDSPLELVRKSIEIFKNHVETQPQLCYNLPRPGTGNGNLDWADVRPFCEALPDNVVVYHKE